MELIALGFVLGYGFCWLMRIKWEKEKKKFNEVKWALIELEEEGKIKRVYGEG